MIAYYYKSETDTDIREINEPKHKSWVYVEAPTTKELSYLAEEFNLDINLLNDALDEDEMPRLEQRDSVSYIFIRFVYENIEGHQRTTPLLFIFDKNHIFTVSSARPPLLDSFFTGKSEYSTNEPAKLFLKTLDLISDHYDLQIKKATKRVKEIKRHLQSHEITSQDFLDFAEIEDEMNGFISSLAPSSSTLHRLQLDRFTTLFAKDTDIIQDLLLNNQQYIESCNMNLKRISNIRTTYSAISNSNLNKRLDRLTVITLILLIPNLFFAMYGMNVPLPFQDEIWAIILVNGICLTVCLIFALLLKSRRSN